MSLVVDVRILIRPAASVNLILDASRSFQKIRIRNFHHVRRPPLELLRLDQEITVDRLHRDDVDSVIGKIRLVRPFRGALDRMECTWDFDPPRPFE